MTPTPDSQEPAPDYLAPGPFTIPGRNWLLLLLLWGLLFLKYAIIFGERLHWSGYLLGTALFLSAPVTVSWITWKLKGELPYWGDNAFIIGGGVLFVLLSIPAYGIGLGGAS